MYNFIVYNFEYIRCKSNTINIYFIYPRSVDYAYITIRATYVK